MPIALTREVSASLAACELSFVDRERIDIDRARAQHAGYVRALISLGCRIEALPAADELPDAVFVEDAALVFDEIAIRTRPGAPSRRAEVESVARVVGRYRTLHSIEAPGTLDGGDVLRVGRDVYVGLSARTNGSGIEQLRALLRRDALGTRGYDVHAVPIQRCLHLKSAVTAVADDTLLIHREWLDAESFASFRLIDVDAQEPHAANALRIGNRVLYPDNFPRTRERLARAGIEVATVDVSELQKAEGATTCCSIVFDEAAARD